MQQARCVECVVTLTGLVDKRNVTYILDRFSLPSLVVKRRVSIREVVDEQQSETEARLRNGDYCAATGALKRPQCHREEASLPPALGHLCCLFGPSPASIALDDREVSVSTVGVLYHTVRRRSGNGEYSQSGSTHGHLGL